MDDLYENLDNYNEESRIAELQTENKDLKSKLEEYASTLDKLQNDFDKLNLEYKKLELNYSSLLKTAKAEIERKTQIIANLNLEKDKMILKSFQNKTLAPFSRNRAHDKPMLSNNYDENRGIHSQRDIKMKEIGCSRKPSSHIATSERKEDHLIVKESPQEDIECKLLNMDNSGSEHVDLKTKNRDVKENIQNKKGDDTFKSRAINNRRKSVPAVSMEIDKFCADNKVLASVGSSKEHSRENTDRGHTNCNFNENQKISSSLEDKNSRCQESDNCKSRYSRYDSDKIDRYRTRDKSLHRRKQLSPDRYQRRPKGYHDSSYHRSENDRHRVKGRVLASPPKDKYHWKTSREKHRNNYEKSLPHDYEKLPHRSQEKYPMKHKTQHSYVESDSKRMKIEQHFKPNEGDQRLQNEREFLEKIYSIEPVEIQFSSCESPDFSHPDVSSHQIKEIKLTATTKLDDPRITNKNYIVKQNNGTVALSTAEGRNVDIVPINKSAWGIKHVSMPEALVQRPTPEIEYPAAEICTETENLIANISMESGEICDLEGLDSQKVSKEIASGSKFPKSDEKQIPVIKFDEMKDLENTLHKINSYKIPKLKKPDNFKQNSTKIKEIISFEKSVHYDISDYKTKICHRTIKHIDESKPLVIPTKEEKTLTENKQVSSFIQSNNELPNIGNSIKLRFNEQKYLTAKEVVEGDLELSDDNFDNNEQPINIGKESDSTQFEKEKDKDQSCKSEIVKRSFDALERVTVETCKNKTTDDGKKIKSKKKPRYKEVKEESKNEDLAQVSEIATKMKEPKKTDLIKTKFSELFDDSSSLISPEDLGLAMVPAPTTLLPGKSVPFFEDALDAADLNTIKPIKDSNVSEKSQNEENGRSIIASEIKCQESIDKTKEMQPETSKEDIESIYKNLEPGILETEEAVKTVIISTGVQPQIGVEDEKQGLNSEQGTQNRIASQDVALKALATSTPHKMWNLNVVPAEIGVKLPETNRNSNDSQTASEENTAVMDSPDSNTLLSQTNSVGAPDVRIFVRRRRKVIKK